MTRRFLKAFQIAFPGPYSIRRDHDGVDETFEVYCETNDRMIVATYFWEAEAEAASIAHAIAAALNLAFHPQEKGTQLLQGLADILRRYPGPYSTRFGFCPGRGEFVGLYSHAKDDSFIECYGPTNDPLRSEIADTIALVLNECVVHRN